MTQKTSVKISVRQTLLKLKAEGKKAFIPYITAGDPSLEATAFFVKALARSGADIIELGLPFSDPVADGPINQRAAERGLKSGTTLRLLLEQIRKLRQEGFQSPLVLFTYLNPLYRMGLEVFAALASEAGLNAVLVVDLPPEEALDYSKILSNYGIECVFLAAPTSSSSRLKKIDKASTAFLYYVSRTGVTGLQNEISESLEEEISKVRKLIEAPLAVGFGISTPEQYKRVAKMADGVIVGSALVQIIEEAVSQIPFSVESTAQKLESLSRKLQES